MTVGYSTSKWTFVRTCQSCGHEQKDVDPYPKPLTSAYQFRSCKKCKSEDLDYGSLRPWTPEAKAEYDAWGKANPEEF